MYLFMLQLCVWGTDGWEKQRSRFLQIPSGYTPSTISDTRVQFHQDQKHFLVVHETQIAIFETTKLECMKQVFMSGCEYGRKFMLTSITIFGLSFSGLLVMVLRPYLMQHCLVTVSWYMLVSWMPLYVYSMPWTWGSDVGSFLLLISLPVSGMWKIIFC